MQWNIGLSLDLTKKEKLNVIQNSRKKITLRNVNLEKELSQSKNAVMKVKIVNAVVVLSIMAVDMEMMRKKSQHSKICLNMVMSMPQVKQV